MRVKVLFIFIFSSAVVLVQQMKGQGAKIHIESDDPLTDSITLDLKKLPMSQSKYSQESYLKVPNGQSVEFSLPSVSEPSYVYLMKIVNGKRQDLVFNSFLLIEPGDSIVIDMGKKGITFTGRGAAKTQFIFELDQIKDEFTDRKADSLLAMYARDNKQSALDYLHGDEQYKKSKQFVDSVLMVKLSLLETYRNRISPLAYEILKTDIVDSKGKTMFVGLDKRLIVGMKNRQELMNRFKENFDDLAKIDTTNSNAKIYSLHYTDNIIQQITRVLSYREFNYSMPALMLDYVERKRNPKFPTEALTYIVQNFNGLLKEKLLATLISWYKPVARAEHFDSIFPQMKSQYFSDLTKQVSLGAPGTDFMDITLPRADGGMFTNRDLMGKVTLVDFWYTGCVWCAQAVRQLNATVKTLKDKYPAFQTLSVSIDQDSAKWKKSIASGIYSFYESINVAAAGKVKYSHPLIKFYNVTSYPTFFLIDKKGKIISIDFPEREAELIAAVKKAMSDLE